jgi:teichoic acid transport system ATP-binding protein
METMSNPLSISLQGLGKVYKLFPSPFDRVKETFHPLRKKYHQRFQALTDISLEIEKGETVGIIGRNGSGKSTLLQVICGILQPSAGTVWKSGRIAALLELGAGFNPEFSGRENVYLNGSILGLSRREIDDCFADILAFADIGEFIDQPVKTYSSGMYVRLAFAVAINVRPDILIVDEALAVGDTLFQAKCFAKFREFQQRGITIIFVTHSIDLITRYCSKVCLLDRGRMKAFGPPQDVIDHYNKLILDYASKDRHRDPAFCDLAQHRAGRQEDGCPFLLNPEENRYGNGKATIDQIGIYSLDGQPAQALKQMEAYEIRLRLVFHSRVENPVIAYIIKDVKGMDICGTNTLYQHVETGVCEPGTALMVSFTQKMMLAGGGYILSVGCAGYDGGEYVVYERRYDVLAFEVAARRPCVGVVDMDAEIGIARSDGGSPPGKE